MSYVEVSLPRLMLALVFIGMAVAVSVRFGLSLGKSMMVGALRAAIQLVSIGYFLVFLFGHQTWWDVASVLAVMLVAAAATSARRIEHGPAART
ncbi:MAG: ABC transporter permease, partial [Polyangiaceae bacterium]